MQIRIPVPSINSANEWAQYLEDISKDEANVKRKSDSRILVDYYNGKQLPYLEDELSKIHTDPKTLQTVRKITTNVTKFVLDNIGTTYSGIVKRTLDIDSSTTSTMFWEGLDEVLAMANRIISGERTLLVRADWSPLKQKVAYTLLHQYQFDLVYDPNSKDRQVLAVIVSDYKPRNFDKTRFFVYTNEKYYEFLGSKLVNENEGVEFLPFCIIHSEPLPIDEDYLNPDMELVNANLQINVAISSLAHLLFRQSHGILHLKLPEDHAMPPADSSDQLGSTSGNAISAKPKPFIKLSPDYLLTTYMNAQGHSPDLSYVSQNPEFQGIIATIRFLLEGIATNRGLPPDTFGIGAGSGTATEFWVKEKRLKGLQKQLEATFETAEKELFQVDIKISDSEKVKLDAGINAAILDVQYIKDEPLIANLTTADLLSLQENGLIDRVEALRVLYPHLTREELENKIIEMAKSEARINEQLLKINPPEKVVKQPDKSNKEQIN
jgi:hypothetical protein